MRFTALVVAMGLVCTNSLAAENLGEPVKDDADLKNRDSKIIITGSRIKRTEIEGMSPITVISAEDIVKQGHANVYEAIRALSANTGGVLDEQTTNSFTASAQAVNLRGFGPGRTLILLNGNRLPSNPKPYGGEDNFVSLALIPTTAVERVEYLSSGGSAIYGSDAIAGVINIVLRKDYVGHKASVRYSDTKDGGGETYRFNYMGGISDATSSFNWGVELDKRTPLYGNQRDWMDENTDSPADDPWLVNDRDILVSYPYGRGSYASNGYQEPGLAACDQVPTYEYSNRPDRGNFCGHDSTGDSALRAPRERINAFANYRQKINYDLEFFVTALAWKSKADSELLHTGWWQQVSVVDDINATNPNWLYDTYYQRNFLPEEVPNEQHFAEDALVLNFGLEGALTEVLDYKLSVSLNDYDYEESIAKFTTLGGLQTFLGIDGTQTARNRLLDNWGTYLMQPSDFLADGYTPANGQNLYQYFNNGELRDAHGLSSAQGNTYTRSISFEVNGDIVELDAGDVGFAAILEFNQQGYSLDIDADTDAGNYVGWSGVGGRGDRDHIALGGEFLVPLVDTLEATVAARYDDYRDKSNVGGAATYQLGLSWRPADEFLVRASYGTTFRAPDMHRLFADNNQYFGQTIDYYACMTENGATAANALEVFKECQNTYGSTTQRANTQGNLNLSEETGYSANLGIVWEPVENLGVTLDFYQINIEDMVTTLSSNRYSQLEAACQMGFDVEGDAVDGNSANCAELYSRIVRQAGPTPTSIEPINEVFLSSINMGLQEITGLDAKIDYKLDTSEFGSFNFGFNYGYVHKVTTQVLKTDVVDDNVLEESYYDFPYKTRSSFVTTWDYQDLTTSLFISQIGSTRNWDGDARTPAYTTANLYFAYQITKELSASLNVVNLTDERPPEEANWEDYPFYNSYAYPNGGIGTEYMATISYEIQ